MIHDKEGRQDGYIVKTRWMPEGEEDLSWPWIKEALPPIQLTKVLFSFAFLAPFCPFAFGSFLFDGPVQDIFELSMILATHSQCNLASLDVFEDDIPQVPPYNLSQITFIDKYHIFYLYRFMKSYRMT